MGRTDFPDHDMLDAMIVSALKKILDKHVHFQKRISGEERRSQKYDQFLRWRHIAYKIHEHFRASGAYEAVQHLSDFSTHAFTMTKFKICESEGTKLNFQQAKFIQKWLWKAYTCQSHRILFLALKEFRVIQDICEAPQIK